LNTRSRRSWPCVPRAHTGPKPGSSRDVLPRHDAGAVSVSRDQQVRSAWHCPPPITCVIGRLPTALLLEACVIVPSRGGGGAQAALSAICPCMATVSGASRGTGDADPVSAGEMGVLRVGARPQSARPLICTPRRPGFFGRKTPPFPVRHAVGLRAVSPLRARSRGPERCRMKRNWTVFHGETTWEVASVAIKRTD
jgi:hypothetical protein